MKMIEKGDLLARLLALPFMFALVVIPDANAGLVSQDLTTAGDNLITYDSDTGFSWLDLTTTAGRSYDEVAGGYGGFTTALGFRYATGDEVGRLFSDAGVAQTNWVWGYWNFGNPNYLSNVALVSVLGVTYPFDGLSTYTFGLTGSTTLSTLGSHDYAYVGYNNHADYIALQAGGAMNNSDSLYDVGSFLVKDATTVSLPATVWLLGSGLAGFLGFGTRRRTKHGGRTNIPINKLA